jgi:hypothetical protein
MKRIPLTILSALITAFGTACGDDTDTPDGGLPDGASCEGSPSAPVTCTEGSCNATTGTKTFGKAELAAGEWVVVSWASSEVAAASENTNVIYTRTSAGGLTARSIRTAPRGSALSAEERAIVYSKERLEKLEAERFLRSIAKHGPEGPALPTGIRGRTAELLPKGAKTQAMTCSDTMPKACGATSLCVIPPGMTSGTCESAVTIKFFGTGPAATDVASTVRKVGENVAVVVDDVNNAAVSAADVDALVQRFDEHIAPRDHQFFGEPKDNGKDFDGNGVVIVFLTSRVGQIRSSLVGFFFSDDLRRDVAHSNQADVLYMQPPGGSVTLDALSGTIAHEYMHIINYYAKVIKGGSDQEEVWLDEGLATFAEDVVGYGRDSFANVLAYLGAPGDTSLTGFGLIASSEQDADGFERRGFGQLMVRYIFEQRGGAEYPSGPGMVTDKGGVAAIRSIVQGPETGIDALLKGGSGRDFDTWLGDLLTTVAIDGTSKADLACNGKYNFQPPEQDPYTMFQRGIDLRGTVRVPGGMDIPLRGPNIVSLESEEVPFPINGGEFRSVMGAATVRVGGPADGKVAFRAIPKP